MRHAAWWIGAIALAFLCGCGSGGGGGDGQGSGGAAGGGDGGGGGPPTSAPDFSLSPNPDFVGSFSGLHLMFTDTANLVVGGHGNDGIRRCVVGFDIDAFAGVTLESARLRVDFQGIRGTPYFNLGGRVVVDRIDLGGGLDVTDARAPSFEEAFGTISGDRSLGEKALDVTAQVQAAIDAGASRVDFRFYFPLPPVPNRGHDWQTLGLESGTFLDLTRVPAAP